MAMMAESHRLAFYPLDPLNHRRKAFFATDTRDGWDQDEREEKLVLAEFHRCAFREENHVAEAQGNTEDRGARPL
jgi:hypothetical protein